jgi:ribonuclease BN (tRNA processing enzyme)
MLLDAGESYWNSSIDAQIIGPYIEDVLGCKDLDYVLITHFHLDHIGYVNYGGLWHLVEEQDFAIGQTLLRDYDSYLGSTSGTFNNWETYLAGDGEETLNPTTAVEGTSQVDLGGGVTFDIVAVDGNGMIDEGDFSSDSVPPSENDYSIGVVISFGLFDEWIGGDISGEYVESQYGYAYHDIEWSVAPEVGDVDVFRVNHHGSDHSNNETFVNQLDPEVSIISVGDANPYGMPRQAVMDVITPTSDVYLTERGDTSIDIGDAEVVGDIVITTTNGTTYVVDGNVYTATNPTRTDNDGDGYFAEVDPDDNDDDTLPAPNGGCDPDYQTCTTCNLSAGDVVINEVLPAPSSGYEWVELYNTTGSSLDLGYCYIDDLADGGGAPYQIPADTTIAAGGYWTLDRSSYFNNSGDYVRLLMDDASTVLDSYSYGSTGYDRSWYRSPDGDDWAATTTTSPTKGASN